MVLRNLDPELAPGLGDKIHVEWSARTLADRRADRKKGIAGLPPAPADVLVRDELSPATANSPELRLRIYSPRERSGPLPGLYWTHGGGMVLADGEIEDSLLCEYVQRFECVIVSVDYRVAPEHPYPTPIEDCYAGLVWTAEQADRLGIRTDRLTIGGVSAGGGLAAGTALLARDRGGPSLWYQLLLCPMLDDRGVTASSLGFDADVSWGRAANQYAWSAYLGDAYGTDDVAIYAAPARADDLSGLPRAFIEVGELEVFRDECIDYAQRLMVAGVSTELHVYPGAFHGSDAMVPTAAVSRRAREARFDAARRALHA